MSGDMCESTVIPLLNRLGGSATVRCIPVKRLIDRDPQTLSVGCTIEATPALYT